MKINYGRTALERSIKEISGWLKWILRGSNPRSVLLDEAKTVKTAHDHPAVAPTLKYRSKKIMDPNRDKCLSESKAFTHIPFNSKHLYAEIH